MAPREFAFRGYAARSRTDWTSGVNVPGLVESRSPAAIVPDGVLPGITHPVLTVVDFARLNDTLLLAASTHSSRGTNYSTLPTGIMPFVITKWSTVLAVAMARVMGIVEERIGNRLSVGRLLARRMLRQPHLLVPGELATQVLGELLCLGCFRPRLHLRRFYHSAGDAASVKNTNQVAKTRRR